jgi:hypothetical protein
MFFLLSFIFFFFYKTGEQEGGTVSAQRQEVGGGVEVAQIMYTHVSKCKNEKIIKKIEWKASSVD